jgi:hypothetical protein
MNDQSETRVGEAGDTHDPDSATQRSGDTIAANSDPGRVSVEEVEADGWAVGPDAPQIISEEGGSEGAVTDVEGEDGGSAQTPSEGILH